ncbi:MAG: 2-dehydropantoate 2-reductase, partial [Bacteroidota bacterium]
MRIAVIGAGGVGGYFGGKLAVAGHEVTLLARGRHLRAIQENGLLVKSIHGDFKAEVLATDQWAEIPPVDLVLVAVKAWQVQEVREHLKSILHESTVVLPLQNGVVAAKELSEVLGEGPVLGGLCRIISKIEAPGVINHFGATPSIILGERQGGTSHRSENIAQSLNEAGIQAIDSPDIRVDLWKKFIFICVG